MKKYKMSRFAFLHIQNDKIGDKSFSPEIVTALREYADALENGEAGFHATEIFNSSGGTMITNIVGSWCGDENTLSDKGLRHELVLKSQPCQL